MSDLRAERELAPRFAAADLRTLWRRFEPLDDMLKAPGDREYVPGVPVGADELPLRASPGG